LRHNEGSKSTTYADYELETAKDGLNDGWVPGQSGTDLNGIGSIDDTPSADTTAPAWDQDLIDSLRETRGLHRQAIRAINKYINQAKANAGIVTPTGVQQKFSRR
jgi:hypothetical protein